MSTLYRQYRPRTFGEVVGQDHVIKTLQAAISKDKLTHAYLFYGPRGTGKTTTARLLAKRINCEKPKQAEPCDKCDSCLALRESRHIDVIEIDAASNRGIDDIRSLRENIISAPAVGTHKIYIIDEVHMLTNEAASALLKTLEEPVKHAVFVLATTELHKVLPTILSRCQVYRFRRATDDEMVGRLKVLLKKEKRVADDDVLLFIADRSDGCYRDAESLLGQLLTLQEKKLSKEALLEFLGLPPPELIESFIVAMQAGDTKEAVAAVDKAFESGYDPEQFLLESIRASRDKALADVGGGGWSVIIRALLQAVQDLAYVPQPLIAVHLAVITVCNQAKPIEAAVNQVKQAPVMSVATVEKKDKVEPKKEEVVASNEKVPEKQVDDGAFAIERVKLMWGNLIEDVKNSNPVASTFLRAVEPIAVSDHEITVRTQYSVHQTFFDNRDNNKLVATSLSKLVGSGVKVKFILDETGRRQMPSVAQQRQNKENKFLETVKEVFS